MPYRLSGNDDDDEDNEDHGANNLILAGNFSAPQPSIKTGSHVCMFLTFIH